MGKPNAKQPASFGLSFLRLGTFLGLVSRDTKGKWDGPIHFFVSFLRKCLAFDWMPRVKPQTAAGGWVSFFGTWQRC